MSNRTHVISLLDALSLREGKEAWVIKYKDKILTLPSGKSSWGSIRDAQSALTLALHRVNESKTVHVALTLRGLEGDGVVKYEKVKR